MKAAAVAAVMLAVLASATAKTPSANSNSNSKAKADAKPIVRIPLKQKNPVGDAEDWDRVLQSAMSRINQLLPVDIEISMRNAIGGEDAKSSTNFTNSVPLRNVYDNSYNAKVTLGNGQVLYADLDTGSSDTWFRGPDCESSDSSCDGANVDVTTLDRTSIEFTTRYGIGHVSGHVVITNLTIGDLTSGNMLVGISTSASMSGDTDGIVGLAYDSISQIDIKSENTAYEGHESNFLNAINLKGEKDVFAFFLSRWGAGEDGEVVFGGYDPKRFEGDILWLPLVGNSYWEFDISAFKYSVGGSKLRGLGDGGLKTAIADTGTTLMVLDDETAKHINGIINATRLDGTGDARFYKVDCALADDPKAPVVEIIVGEGRSLKLPASAYVLRSKSDHCLSGFASGAMKGIAIFGDVILREYYSIYDRHRRRVGLAKGVHRGLRELGDDEMRVGAGERGSGFVSQKIAVDDSEDGEPNNEDVSDEEGDEYYEGDDDEEEELRRWGYF